MGYLSELESHANFLLLSEGSMKRDAQGTLGREWHVPSFSVEISLKTLHWVKLIPSNAVGTRTCNRPMCVNKFPNGYSQEGWSHKNDKKKNKSRKKYWQNFGRRHSFRTQVVCTRLALIKTQWKSTGEVVSQWPQKNVWEMLSFFTYQWGRWHWHGKALLSTTLLESVICWILFPTSAHL